MKYGSLQAILTHAFAERGMTHDDGTPIQPVGKLYDSYEEYRKANGTAAKVESLLSRMHVVKPAPTLDTLAHYTAQELFDHVAAHLLRQNARSEFANRIWYHCPEGKKSAVGSLIPEEQYDLLMEDEYLPATAEHHKELLMRLERIHDTMPVRSWLVRLYDTAADYGLAYTVLQEHEVKQQTQRAS